MKYDIILCDADGVVIKSAYLFSERLVAEYGIPPERVAPFFQGKFLDCLVGKADLKEELAKVIKDWGWPGSVDDLIRFWHTEGTVIDRDMTDFIQELRRAGARCYMVTDNEKYRGEYLEMVIGGGQVFEEIFYAAKVGARKRDPAFFPHVYGVITKTETVPKDRILVIDDDQRSIEAAQAFGFDGHLYTDLPTLKQSLA